MAVAKDVLSALTYLHENGIVHRDIKAANILLEDSGRIRIGDFGVSGLLTEGAKGLVGSPYWMAPEVILNGTGDAKSDIWSFAVTIIELLRGHPPLWQLGPSKAMQAIPRSMPPRLEADECSPELANIVHACLHDDPSKVK